MPVPLWVPICQTEHIAKYDSTSSTMPQRSHPGKTSVSASRPAIGDLSTKHGQIPSKVTSSASAIFGTQIGLAHCSKISKAGRCRQHEPLSFVNLHQNKNVQWSTALRSSLTPCRFHWSQLLHTCLVARCFSTVRLLSRVQTATTPRLQEQAKQSQTKDL